MGISHSTARWVAPASFIVDFAAQQYGLLVHPNMLDIHDKHLSFWSPYPYFIGAFFAPQQILQLVWLYRLWKLDPSKGAVEEKEVQTMVDFVPYYAVGNLCIAVWMLFWNSENLKTSNLFVLINSLTQLYFIFGRLGPMDKNSRSSVLTHWNAKTFAGIGVLDMLHNGAVAYFDHQTYDPSTLIKVVTGVAFFGLASVSDWIFGGCLVYDLVALAVGQRIYTGVGWSNLLGAYALGTAGIVGLRNYLRPPYISSKVVVDGYTAAPTDEPAV